MIAQSRYIVIYKDSADSRNLYFGPFTSLRTAEEFLDGLPEPQPGGSKTYKHLQPHTHNETDIASAVVLSQRQRDVVNRDALRLLHAH